LSFALKKQHLVGFENIKSLILWSNNISYIDEDLLTDLTNLTGLNLRDNNLRLINGIFNHSPQLQWLELADNNLQSIELGTFGNLKNLTLLNLWQNHLMELQSGIFDELVALQSLDLNRNDIIDLPKPISISTIIQNANIESTADESRARENVPKEKNDSSLVIAKKEKIKPRKGVDQNLDPQMANISLNQTTLEDTRPLMETAETARVNNQSEASTYIPKLNVTNSHVNNSLDLDHRFTNIFAKLKNLKILNFSLNNFTHLPRNLLRNNTKLQTFTLTENKRNMTLPEEFFANLTELKVLNLGKKMDLLYCQKIFSGDVLR